MIKKRSLKNWIDSYLFFTEKQESPEEFHRWCAISALAAAMERSCWLDNGYYNLFPNQYIVLVGASASVRKSSAIALAEAIFKEAFPEAYLFSQKITPVSLFLFLRDSYQKRKVSGGYIVADELSVFLGSSIQDATLIQILTKIYTCPTTMDYSTVQRGRELAHNTFCNLLGGTTPEWIKDSFPAHAIGGGFAGRIAFIYLGKTDRRFARPKLSPERREIRKSLVADLKQVGELKGEFNFTPEAEKWYTTWYEEVFNPDTGESDLKGYYGRKHDLVLKIAMVLSVARSNSMEILQSDISDSIDMLSEVEKMLPETLRLIQATQIGQNQQKILSHIQKSPNQRISRTRLMRLMSYMMSAKDLDELITTLVQSDRIKVVAEDTTNAIFYELK